MRDILLATIVMVSLVLTVSPEDVEASNTVAGVAVFTTDAVVGAGALSGDGLCHPGLRPTFGACEFSPLPPPLVPDNEFLISAPALVTLPNGLGAFPGQCLASGAFAGGVSVGPCTLAVNGVVTAVFPGTTGPACGHSAGKGAGTLNGRSITMSWLSGPGDLLFVTGTVFFSGGDNHLYTGLVQAHAFGGGACLTVPAQVFTMTGVLAATPFHV